jgi:hypothetical protein
MHGSASVRDAEVAGRGDALGFAIQADAPVAHVVGFASGGRSRFVWTRGQTAEACTGYVQMTSIWKESIESLRETYGFE